ncbi:MAG: PAS domain-containing sensor histidine kinase [Alphaproteobacteria bacterium]|nr:PAS domain-containing sensor histidine kinase [Alphaproteobacteria bacterium]
MYYIDFWANYWKNLAEMTERQEAVDSPKKSPLPPQYKPHLSPDEKYSTLTEYGTQILALFSAAGDCTYVSKNFETITGYGKEAAAGLSFYSLIAPESRERVQELIRLQHSSHTPQIIRAKITHANHKNQWYMFMLHPKKHDRQQEIVCVVENIHENILTQNTLQKARMEAELALRSRSEFLANMSHDLRTPLNAVLGFSQMITSEVLGSIDNPQYMEYARHIQESGYDLLAKIEDLLEIASLDAGHVTLDKSCVRVGEILKQVVDAQTHHTQAKKIRLVCDATNNGTELFVDRLKIQHILGHLVANAIKHCRSGQQINIRTSKLKDGGFRLRVTDNGGGMDELRLGQVRHALSEKNCWTSKHGQGIGLGLALTKEFVELHGGELVVESTLGNGTTVDILLPRDCTTQSSKVDYIRHLVG